MPHNDDRGIAQGPQELGANEKMPWAINTEKWGGSTTTPPSFPIYIAYDISTNPNSWNNVTSTVFPGTPPATIEGINVKLPLMQAVIPSVRYLVKVGFMIDGATKEAHLYIDATR